MGASYHEDGLPLLATRDQSDAGLLSLLGETEIGHADVAVQVKQDVFRLEISVDVALGVDVLKDKNHLTGVEAHLLLREAASRLLLDGREQLTTRAVLHDHEQALRALERVVERRDEGVVRRGQKAMLREDGAGRLQNVSHARDVSCAAHNRPRPTLAEFTRGSREFGALEEKLLARKREGGGGGRRPRKSSPLCYK